jgi:hypothetical protein
MIRALMPWKATGPGDLTLLTARGRRLTKRITPAGIEGYDNASLFWIDARRLECVEDIPELLIDLAGKPNTCVIRAALKEPIGPHVEIRCWIHDRDGVPARFAEVPRAWVMVDLEPTACPVDPTDPVLVGGWLRRRLPPAFQVARCVVQLSSSAGIKPGARAHLWFKLDRPLGKAELDQLLAGVDGLDPSTFRPRQFHYTASPIFAGVDDPCFERIAVLAGYPAVAVPELAPARPRPAFVPIGFARSGAGGAERYAAACLRRLALAPEGRRHPTCIATACRLFAIAKAGQLNPVRVAAQIKAVMLGRGFDGRDGRDLAEVDSILAWAWRTAEPEGLKR